MSEKDDFRQRLGGPTYKLQKALAEVGLGSRRDMEGLVREGRVTVNGAPAAIGARVGPSDVILVDGRPIGRSREGEAPRVLLYYKPEGEIVSHDDPGGRASVFDHLPPPRGGKWLAVGRLDLNTSGLLVFTTSGELANRMMHPRYEVEREYAVRVLGRVTPEQQKKLVTGIELDDGVGRCESIRDQGGEGANHWYHVVIREGRNREVRRLFDALRLRVSRLMRVRFGTLTLPRDLKRGRYIELRRREVGELMAELGLQAGPVRTEAARGSRPERHRRPGYRSR